MKVLALDTATTDLVTGIVDTDTGESIDRVITDTRAHNEQLIPTIEELLVDASLTYPDLSALVVGTGPGPFTGLRVGMATASALGVALNLPVYGVCTLDAIAHGRAGEWLVAIDARRKEVYWGTYADGRRVSGPEVSKPETLEMPTDSARLIFPESIAPRLPEALSGLPREWATPRAAGLVACADFTAEPAPLVPLYLRRPDAKVPQAKPRSTALVGGAELTES
ncbi:MULTISPECIES: tRNA (adenosine(37)-N6)-threonylcarbamoyltransferase complex dimerization subunit type 1 TsaB [Corynebacterium]|uniref:tRNA (adenosine(37)-N6)-threonylcarbamoyltransferase complex dimerization subunit type 1 TsaB n=1 Tax=Corynebacterium TaxID=1716 RepID=UPI0011A3F0D2|nr:MULTISPECIES: tRNA (adenosine(37)-N6)-threonylcarbamoyltransferase complex dimerization subunit type 1 TsaB [Corynebacterium]MCQ9676049.1 tRNA (adenosine(37)-N6)-threonylcarbamoyltransferase complex dimerization subunit type 1 TsaB [Corynebacterium sp. BF-R-2]